MNKYILGIVLAVVLASGAFGGYYYTNQHYQDIEAMRISKEVAQDEKNLICEARVQRGKTGDVKSEYFIIERSAEENDCMKFIEYKNIPDDTRTFWLSL